MIKLLNILLVLLISACAHDHSLQKPEKDVIKETVYIVKIPPKELLTIPANVPNINIDTATQTDVARWIISNEKRMLSLESMIVEIANFLNLEQQKLNEDKK